MDTIFRMRIHCKGFKCTLLYQRNEENRIVSASAEPMMVDIEGASINYLMEFHNDKNNNNSSAHMILPEPQSQLAESVSSKGDTTTPTTSEPSSAFGVPAISSKLQESRHKSLKVFSC